MATYTDALAQVYAKSLYELGEDAGGRDKIVEVGQEIEQLCELTRSDKAFGEFLASPIINKGERSRSLRHIFDGNITDLTLRFLLVLNERGRLGHLAAIEEAYDQLMHQAFGRVEVDLYTAAPLDGQELESIKERIHKALGKDPVLHVYTQPSMIGGVKLRIGDQLIDGSVSNRLRRLRQTLKTSGISAMRDRIASLIEEGET